MTTLRIYSLNSFPIYHTAVVPIAIMLYITSLGLMYLITGSLYLLTTFIKFSLSPTPAASNHKSNLFFYEFGVFLGFFRFHI